MQESEREQMLTRATELHMQGQLPQAEVLYYRLLEEGTNDNVQYLLGTLQLQQRKPEQAVQFLEPVAERHPESADLHNNLGVAYRSLKQPDKALRAFQAAIQADREYPQAYQNLGKLLSEGNQWAQAEACFRAAATLLPEDTEIHSDWIKALTQLQRWDEVAQELEKALARTSQGTQAESELNIQLAYCRTQQKRYAEAAELFEAEQKRHPQRPELLANLSYVYEHLGRMEDSLQAADRAIELAPAIPELHNNRGVALRGMHRCQEALAAFWQAVSLRPEFALAEFNHGTLQLLMERYPEGWRGYERRLEMVSKPPGIEALPTWTGENQLTGGKLLVYCDQGFGDALQFVRFLPQIKERAGCSILLQLPAELLDLVRQARINGNPLADEFLVEGQTLPQVSACFPLLSCGTLLNLKWEDLSPQPGYLQVPPATDEESTAAPATTETQQGSLRVGLSWRGNAQQAQDHVRTMSLSELSVLASLPGITWHSLQLDATPAELATWPVEIIDWGTSLKSFSDTARKLDQLDLLISVDTAICHLAGALDQPVWTLLPHTPDWRWHLERTDSPWYPRMQLYRQPTWGDWPSAISALKQDLEKLTN